MLSFPYVVAAEVITQEASASRANASENQCLSLLLSDRAWSKRVPIHLSSTAPADNSGFASPRLLRVGHVFI
jgi:hypothetical protein